MTGGDSMGKVEGVYYTCESCPMTFDFKADSLDELVEHIKEHRFRCPARLNFRVVGAVDVDTARALEIGLVTPDGVLAPYLAALALRLSEESP